MAPSRASKKLRGLGERWTRLFWSIGLQPQLREKDRGLNFGTLVPKQPASRATNTHWAPFSFKTAPAKKATVMPWDTARQTPEQRSCAQHTLILAKVPFVQLPKGKETSVLAWYMLGTLSIVHGCRSGWRCVSVVNSA